MNDSLLEEGDVPDCPACGGPGVILGKLVAVGISDAEGAG